MTEQLNTNSANIKEYIDPNVIVMAACAILRQGKVLIVKEEHEPYNGSWVLPQGYVRSNETLDNAVRREIGEELGVEIGNPQFLGVYEDFVEKGVCTLHYVIACYVSNMSDEAEPRPSREVIDFAWINPSNKFDSAPSVIQRMLRDVSNFEKKKAPLFWSQTRS